MRKFEIYICIYCNFYLQAVDYKYSFKTLMQLSTEYSKTEMKKKKNLRQIFRNILSVNNFLKVT